MKKTFDIIIIPAKFVKKTDDGEFIIDVFIQNKPKPIIERRIFRPYSLKGICNPNLIFIGIMTGEAFQQINFTDANEYEDLFKKKWNSLLK